MPVAAARQLRAFSNTLSLMRRRIPRAVNLVAQGVVFPALFVGAPVSLSQRGRRYGWSAGRPGLVNLVGALPLGAGAALLLWAMSSHYRAAPRGWEIRPTPDYLLTGGPYRVSRNPMYVGETAIWAGWAVLFGSLPVTAGLLAVTAVQNGAVRVEERMLHKRWAAYDDYRAQVPRWLKCRPCLAPPRVRRDAGAADHPATAHRQIRASASRRVCA